MSPLATLRRRRNITTVGIPLALGLLAAAVIVLVIVGGGKHRQPSGSGGTVRAQNVVGSIGVNVHMSYLDTSYARFPQIEQRLKALGVRTIRDGACSGCKQENQRLGQLGAAGIKLDLIMGDPRGQTGTLPQLIGLVRGPLAPFVTSVEGPNEYDNQGDPNWLPRLRAYQRQLYDTIKKDPKLRHIQVLGPSLVRSSSYGQLGNIGRMLDAGNLHPYPPNGGPPAANIEQELRLASTIAPGRPLEATETGYRTGGPPQPGNRPLTEQQEAAYLPALVLEYYRAGIRRSFLYELADEKPDPQGKDAQQHYGLLRQDLSPKPAYSALQNLIGLLSSAGPAKSSLDAPRATASSLDGSPIHTLTIQRGDGSQVVAMWLTSPGARAAVGGHGKTHPVELALGERAPVDVYRPSLGKDPQQRLRPTTQAKIQLGADPVLAVIKSSR